MLYILRAYLNVVYHNKNRLYYLSKSFFPTGHFFKEDTITALSVLFD